MSLGYVMTVFTPWKNTIVYVMGKHEWCHGGMSWRYVIKCICHGGMSWEIYMSLNMSWRVYVMKICHQRGVYVIEVCHCKQCHGDMSLTLWWYVIETVYNDTPQWHIPRMNDISQWHIYLSSGMYMSCWYIMKVCHCVSLRTVSWWYVIGIWYMSFIYVMVVYVIVVCHW